MSNEHDQKRSPEHKDELTRRRFIGGAASLGLTALGLSAFGQEQNVQRAGPRNVVMIISDQLNAYTIGAAGCDVETPNIDRLARQGTWLRNATCGYPLCVPSRICMFTGVYPHQRDYFGNRGGGRGDAVRAEFAQKNAATPIMTKRFADAGYDCRYALKWHIPVDQRDPEKSGLAWYGSGSPQARTNDLLGFMKENDGTQPFFYTFSYDIPHQICGWARKHAQGEHDGDDSLPPGDQCPELPENFPKPDPWPEALATARERSSDRAYPTGDYDREDWRQYRWAYRKFTEGLDDYVGQVLDALDNSPHRDNTVVVFVADHGDGDSSHHWNQKVALWEECVRVPWIIRAPGAPAGVEDDRPVSSGIDLVPTVMDLAGLPVPENLQGQSLKPVVMGRDADLREYSVSETSIGRQQGRCIRTQRYKYTAYGGDHGEAFYDLEEDPGEMDNRIDDPAMAAEIDRHRKLLAGWCEQTDDRYFRIPDTG